MFCPPIAGNLSKITISIAQLPTERLTETLNFQSFQDRDSLRPKNLEVSETDTYQNWAKVVETDTFSRVSLFTEVKYGC